MRVRHFVLFVLAAFLAMLMLAGLYFAVGVTRAPLTGGAGLALLDVALYALLTFGLWWVLSRRLRR